MTHRLDDDGICPEIHALSPHRQRAKVDAFLARYATRLQLAEEDLHYPPNRESPTQTPRSADELIEFLLSDPGAEYALYWSGEDRGASLHFLPDGSLVCAVVRDPTKDVAPQILELAKCIGARFAYAEGENPPPDSGEAVVDRAHESKWSIWQGVPTWTKTGKPI
jgi:hypothetical protein